MRADLDLLCISVYCTADDLLPAPASNARRKLTEAEIVTLCVAQVLMGSRVIVASCGRPAGNWGTCSRCCQPKMHCTSGELCSRDTIEWLTGVFATSSPGASDELLLLDSTPVECGHSVETTRRPRLAEIAGYGYCRSHSRWFWGMRLHLACAPDGTPRAACLAAADRPEREIALTLLPRALKGGETITATRATPAASSPTRSPSSAPRNLRARIATRLLAATISLNHQLGRPSPALADYTA